MKRRAEASSDSDALRARSQVFLRVLAPAILAQPETNASRLGSRLAHCQPGSVENSAGSYVACSATGFGGCGHAGQTGHEGHCGGCTDAHPAANSTIAAMWVIFLEMAVALALLILIVWWTWPRKRKDDER